MHELDEFLKTFSSPIQRAKARTTLEKRRGAWSEINWILDAFRRGDLELRYQMGYGKKRGGLRLPTKPKWSIWSRGTGYDVSRTAAEFANYLLSEKYDLESLENAENEKYQRELEVSS